MPVVFRYKGFRFFFYSNEGQPTEPSHIHVEKGGDEAEFWLRPEIALADSAGFDRRTLRELEQVVTANRTLIEERWNGHFG